MNAQQGDEAPRHVPTMRLRGVPAAMALISATVLELGRQSGVPAWNSLWAEDGMIFLSGALNESFHKALFEPYNGYMLLVPRVAAEIVALFPLSEAAWITAFIASSLVASVAVFVYYASSVAFSHRAPRATLSAGIVLLPTAAFETTANLANVHWYLVFACFWALVSPRASLGALTVRTAFAVAAPLTNPMAGLLTPLVLFRWGDRTSRLEAVPRIGFLAGLATQAVVVLRAPADSPDAVTTPFNLADLPPILAVRVAEAFFVGDRFLEPIDRGLGTASQLGAVVLLGVVIAYAVRRLDRRRRMFALVAGTAAAAYFVVPLAIRGTSEIWPAAGPPNLGGSRYFVLPILFLFVVFLLGVDASLDAPRTEARNFWLYGTALWLTSLAFLNYSITNPRSTGPEWRMSLRQAQQSCRADRVTFVDVGIAPGGTWFVRAPCER